MMPGERPYPSKIAGEALVATGVCLVAFGIWGLLSNAPLGSSTLALSRLLDRLLIAFFGPARAATAMWILFIIGGLAFSGLGIRTWRRKQL